MRTRYSTRVAASSLSVDHSSCSQVLSLNSKISQLQIQLSEADSERTASRYQQNKLEQEKGLMEKHQVRSSHRLLCAVPDWLAAPIQAWQEKELAARSQDLLNTKRDLSAKVLTLEGALAEARDESKALSTQLTASRQARDEQGKQLAKALE